MINSNSSIIRTDCANTGSAVAKDLLKLNGSGQFVPRTAITDPINGICMAIVGSKMIVIVGNGLIELPAGMTRGVGSIGDKLIASTGTPKNIVASGSPALTDLIIGQVVGTSVAGASGDAWYVSCFDTLNGAQPNFFGAGMFGDGSDGVVSISGTVTLTRDMYYETLTIPAGQTLNTNGYRVFCRVSINGTGNITRNGNAGANGSGASGGAAGAALNQGSLNMEVAGGAGGTGAQYSGSVLATNGTNGTSVNSVSNVNGVAGGNAGSMLGGLAGISTRGNHYDKVLKPYAMLHPATFGIPLLSIASSGGGAGNDNRQSAGGAYGGGGGGAGGNAGVVWIATKDFNFTGTVSLVGGAGGGGGTPNSGGGGGGGGGGNGGIFLRIYQTLTADCTKTLTGGAAGVGSAGNGSYSGNNGANGSAGNAGQTISIVV